VPKTKTHQGLRKRIRVTGAGKLIRGRQGAGHLKEKKSARRRRRLGEEVPIARADAKRLRRLLPYD
jgi:large subunit ribosomal protein L35